MPLSLTKYMEIALLAAREAGAIQKEMLDKKKEVAFKGEINLVTEVDKGCEARIVEIIRREFPDHNLLTEETLIPETASPYKWIIDPLDGTTNYAHGYPVFAVSIALEVKGEVLLGVVLDPTRDELFTVQKGEGAYLNGRKLSVSSTASLNRALLATGFPYDLRESRENNVAHFNRFIFAAQAVRRDGSAALNLCYVAAGRFDGFWELKLYPWDVAAGKLMVEEAGGQVSDFTGKGVSIYDRQILASNGRIHEEMVHILSNR
jgi:myo-inositol-1(or 4)-monophosphatase